MQNIIEGGRPPPPLPVTIVPGMQVCDVSDIEAGTVAGITQGYCIYRTGKSHVLQVANWRNLALVNIGPAAPLLPAEAHENDRRNVMATLLGELLAMQELGPLTPAQTASLAELIQALCGK